MSYILDALRRADSERERGAVPDLHAQPVPMAAATDDDDEAPATPLPAWVWLGAMLLLLLIGVLVWMLLGRDEAPTAAPTRVNAAEAAADPAPINAVGRAVAVASAPVAAAPVPPPVAPRLEAAAKPKPQTPPPTRPAVAPAAERKPVAAKVEAPVLATLPKAAAADTRVYTLAELPDDIRRSLPTLAIGGAMYSESAANRMLIVNGQLFHQGDELAPGLVLVQIKLKSAVLEFKGYRYGISY